MREFNNIKIAVAGTGYVGMSIATLLAQHHEVVAVDVLPEKVEKINQKISPIQDDYIEQYMAEKPLCLSATLDGTAAYSKADFCGYCCSYKLRSGKELLRHSPHRGCHRPCAQSQS